MTTSCIPEIKKPRIHWRHQTHFTKLLWGPQSNTCTYFCGAVTVVQFLGSPAEVEENWVVRRGTGCWRWQIAEASRASSITPCGYTMWLPPPQETWSTFHLYKTGVFGGINKDFRSILCCYSNAKDGSHIYSVLLFFHLLTVLIYCTCHPPPIDRGGKST